MKRLAGVTMLSRINVQAESAERITEVQNGITELLRQRHRIQPGRDDDFMMRSQQELAETQTATADSMTALLAGVAIISLIVGGIGIMNIMLVSVTERTREIGIRMAVGARGRDILLQFLVEAVALSSTGGVLGIALGFGGAKLITLLKQWPTLVLADSIIVAFVFSAAVGIFFGFYPARKASKLDPIDALRYE
jgi:putative ABC transport system permease protein